MFDSIYKDIRYQFSHGNMISRIIITNVAICILINILLAFTPSGNDLRQSIIGIFAISGDLSTFITRPWTIFTAMFSHIGLWHLIVNMLYIYWFGRIVGDLIGDKHVLPIYVYGGVAGSIAYVVSYYLIGSGIIGSYALGASAAAMALVVVAGLIAPEYIFHLILIGPVRLKYIVLAIIVMDLLAISAMQNTGGHIAHLGGMFMGYLYLRMLHSGRDLSFRLPSFNRSQKPRRKATMTVSQTAGSRSEVKNKKKKAAPPQSLQAKVDKILEKIKASGYESLTDEEKETLFQASKSDQ